MYLLNAYLARVSLHSSFGSVFKYFMTNSFSPSSIFCVNSLTVYRDSPPKKIKMMKDQMVVKKNYQKVHQGLTWVWFTKCDLLLVVYTFGYYSKIFQDFLAILSVKKAAIETVFFKSRGLGWWCTLWANNLKKRN